MKEAETTSSLQDELKSNKSKFKSSSKNSEIIIADQVKPFDDQKEKMVQSQGGYRYSLRAEGLTSHPTQAMTNCNNDDHEGSYRDLPDVAEFLNS